MSAFPRCRKKFCRGYLFRYFVEPDASKAQKLLKALGNINKLIGEYDPSGGKKAGAQCTAQLRAEASRFCTCLVRARRQNRQRCFACEQAPIACPDSVARKVTEFAFGRHAEVSAKDLAPAAQLRLGSRG